VSGYGRGWSEDKAAGFARISQIMREPAGHMTYIVLGVFMFLAMLLLFTYSGASS